MTRLLDRTKKKISSAIKLTDKINAIDFPYDDSKYVMEIIRNQFVELKELLADLSEKDSIEAIQQICKRCSEFYDKYLPVLGYIERSADLDGAVELHGPLLRMTHKAININARLIISSEWYFSPFTALVDDLNARDIVMVGMPRSEASNALIAPAAGHELGHNIWLKEKISEKFDFQIKEIVCNEIKNNWLDNWEKIINLPIETIDPSEGFMAEPYYALAIQWGKLQCEEVFCDFIGLLLFRESYLYTFEYLSAPGDKDRTDYIYPSLLTRAELMNEVSVKENIPIPDAFVSSFIKSSPCVGDQFDQQGLVSDVVCKKLWNELYNRALHFVKNHNLLLFDDIEVEKNINAFRLVVPASKNKGIVNIINAAWRVAIEEKNFFKDKYPKTEKDQNDVLNELVLKSFEIFEIEQKMGVS